MNQGYYARLFKPRLSLVWWLERPSYVAFVLRELSSVFVAWFVVFLLLLVQAVLRGPDAYQRFLERSASPWLIALNVVSLGFVLYHAITFINLTPQAVVVRLRGHRVPGPALAGGLYLAWAIVSALIAWLVMG